MKKLLLASAMLSALLMAGRALAADVPVLPADVGGLGPVYKPVPSWVAAPVFNWNGPYVGFNFGWGWEHIHSEAFDSAGVLETTTTQRGHGFVGGVQVGWNWMVGPGMLIGMEADVEIAGIRGTSAGCTVNGCATGHSRLEDFGTGRARIGYAWDSVLFYGTGGGAWGESKVDRTITCVRALPGDCPGTPSTNALVGTTASAARGMFGWTAGGGIEWGFFRNWSVRAEYLHIQFDNVNRNFNYPASSTGFRRVKSNDDVDLARVGINYLFNWIPTPVFAKF
jgi:outer membrane immunogenic protein